MNRKLLNGMNLRTGNRKRPTGSGVQDTLAG